MIVSKLQNLIGEHRQRLLISFALVGLAGLLLFGQTRISASDDQRVVTIHVDGQELSISTKATKVADVLEQAEIRVNEHDLVEPAAETTIIGGVFSVNIYRARPVTIVDGETEVRTMSPYQSPRLIADMAGFDVYDEDEFQLERIDNILVDGTVGQELTIDRATPLRLSLYGKMVEVRTQAGTVEGMLAEQGIDPEDQDVIRPSAESPISEGMVVAVATTGKDVVSQEEPIAFETQEIQDSNRLTGTREVQTPGVNGVRVAVYELVLENGQEVSRRQLESVVKTEPVKQVVIVGTKVADSRTNVAIGQELAAARGWTGAEWSCLYQLWMKESGWVHTKSNYSGSGAYGIPQALPGSKMSSAGADWATNPATQIKWGLGYIQGRFGTPCKAWSHFKARGWY